MVCPVDPYVDEDYFETVKELAHLAERGEANLVLMGIEPTYPSEKYGYVIPESKERVSKVSTFKEKPTADVAKQYIAKGALWNGGVFAFQLGYIIKKRHMSSLTLRIIRICLPGMKPYRRSALTMRSARKKRISVSCALLVSGRISEPGTP